VENARNVNGELAAVDLGSNSFHMLVASYSGGQPVVLDRIREQVQLGAGLTRKGRLTASVKQRALDCLERFGQRIRGLDVGHVRAVGTNTLRNARNAPGFLARASEALGHEVEVISGDEEARLIYLGVAHSLAASSARRLVVDIGGGSTECIIGERFERSKSQSLEMGCVSFSREFFPHGEITPRGMEEAVLAARVQLRQQQKSFRKRGWSETVGSSGTIKAVEAVLHGLGHRKEITARGLKELRDLLLAAGQVANLDLDGLGAERAPVFPGGVAVLTAVFASLRIERMRVAQGALREGLLYDLLGRLQHEDVRDTTVRHFESRYPVDSEQADRVEETALGFFDQVAEAWRIDDPELRQTLCWASRLHEIGLAVAFERHHRHAGYLVANSRMPGFSREGQYLLGAIIESHRRRLRRPVFERLAKRMRKPALRLAILLRLAVRLHRGRDDQPLPALGLEARNGSLRVRFPAGWLKDHPLTQKDLDSEVAYLERFGVSLTCASAPDGAPVPA